MSLLDRLRAARSELEEAVEAPKSPEERLGETIQAVLSGPKVDQSMVDRMKHIYEDLIAPRRAAGASYREIASFLNANGVRTRRGKAHWFANTVRREVLAHGGE